MDDKKQRAQGYGKKTVYVLEEGEGRYGRYQMRTAEKVDIDGARRYWSQIKMDVQGERAQG